MKKCSKCGWVISDNDKMAWKCTECGKAFRVNLSKLKKLYALKNKPENSGKSLLKCSACGKGIDNGNEMIACKCSACGNIMSGSLRDFADGDKSLFNELCITSDLTHYSKSENNRRSKKFSHPKNRNYSLKAHLLVIIGSVLIVSLFMVLSLKKVKDIHDKEIEKYCELSSVAISTYDNEKDCISALLDCKEKINNMDSIIKENFRTDETKCFEFEKVLEKNFDTKIEEIIENFNGSLLYSSSDIKSTLKDNGNNILKIRKEYDESDYRRAFLLYLSYISDTYVENCEYYILHTLYPDFFSNGIKDSLLGIGVYIWGDMGQEELNDILSYIDSMPEGRGSYTTYISPVHQRLFNKNEQEGITINGKKPPAIGMTADEVRASSWGNPKDINKDTYSWGVKEQWCYSDYRYIYLEDGIVTSISE